MKKSITSLLLLLLVTVLQAQVPQNFAYQAVVRNAQGQVIANQDVAIKISLLVGSISGDVAFSEIHAIETSIQGVINLTIGNGSSQIGNIAAVPWNNLIFVKVEIDPAGGTSFAEMGTSQILSVPYALKAGSLAKNPIEVLAPDGHDPEEPIFVVKNSDGKVVFAVYETGTRVYVDKSTSKGSRGGFAIGGIGDNNKEGVVPHYLAIEPDSVRFNITQNAKNTRGGFAIGGIGDNIKEQLRDYLYIRPDSIRFATDESLTEKGSRGGFAIGGIGDNIKAFNNYFYVNQDCTYVSNTLNAAGNVVVIGDMLTGGTIGVIPTPPVTDFEGNEYQTTRIGNQVWMAENLRTVNYRDGFPIEPSAVFQSNPPFMPYFESGFLNPQEWGFLYSLAEMDYTDKNICPIGWRLPTNDDWVALISSIGGPMNGIKLIDNTPDLWWNFKKSNSKSTGFKAKPAGQFEFNPLSTFSPAGGNPSFSDWHFQAYFWSQPVVIEGPDVSTIFNIQNGNYYINLNDEYFYGTSEDLRRGYSIRCIKE
jgi:uncharacterized protein (TIGR02145 family)